MLYRETGVFKTSYEADQAVLPIPLDKWFGTFHDGSPEAHERMQERYRAKKERIKAKAAQ